MLLSRSRSYSPSAACSFGPTPTAPCFSGPRFAEPTLYLTWNKIGYNQAVSRLSLSCKCVPVWLGKSVARKENPIVLPVARCGGCSRWAAPPALVAARAGSVVGAQPACRSRCPAPPISTTRPHTMPGRKIPSSCPPRGAAGVVDGLRCRRWSPPVQVA